MPLQTPVTPPSPDIDPVRLAQACRAVARQRFPAKTSCIETSQLFERAAAHLGLPVSRVVCQAVAYSPKLADLLKAGTANKESIGQPGMWSVGVGIPESPEDYVGREDTLRNRFVGHVVCIVEDHLVDPSADQMSRPHQDMPIPNPVICKMDEAMRANQVAWTETAHGVLVKYILYPDVKVPPAKSGKIIERLALGVAREFGAGAARRG